ncbi:CHAT domain-containing protein [Actinocrispum wychmicini]|uniref:CHAT domain-containing protein n=1 Tax=Actinocrispum wychmicini TaxID=1213861 RepID=A0A4R2JPR4_9PSEU|nr:CHAT domain-containing protein [Actinocrispum wychmicini]TCO62173.1 CHAT domain-containing protein [Actinocrispum wychmicini]
MIEYEELRVRVRRIGRCRYLVLANGPAAAGAVVHIDPGNEFRRSYRRLLDEEFRRVDRAHPTVRERLRELGERLFATLFPDPLANCLFDSAHRAEKDGRRLRIRFELAPELGDLPMEILRPPPPHRWLVGHASLSLTRTVQGAGLAPGRLPTAASRPEKFRVVAVAAGRWRDASTEPRLDLDAEMEALRAELAAGARPAAVALEPLGWSPTGRRINRPTVGNLRAALAKHAEMPTVVVIVGHGTGGDGTRGGRVFLENSDGTRDSIAGERLATELAAAPNLRLVVLNLCAGADNGSAADPGSAVADELIARGIPAVVAMQADVSDSAAKRFTPTLLAALAANRSLDEAVAAARQDLVNPEDETTVEWATPVLMLHQQCWHTWLFKAVTVASSKAVPVDPLAAGARATAEVNDPPDGVVRIEALAEAARFAWLQGDWAEVVRYADLGGDDERLDWLAQEGRLELAMDRCRAICEQLAEERDPSEARVLLDGIRAVVPEQMYDCLDSEIRLADKASGALRAAAKAAESGEWAAVIGYCDEVLSDLPGGYGRTVTLREHAIDELDVAATYQRGGRHVNTWQWQAAAADYAAVVARRPNGYREADRWEQYCLGHVAEAAREIPAAIAAYAAAGDIADASGRSSLCQAWQAEIAGDWRAAVACYEMAQRSGVDDELAHAYAVGRLAFADGEFARAALILGELPELLYGDARVRGRFAEGKVAFATANWDQVLDALHVLPSDFLPDEVGRMRGLARAHLAVAREEWQAVVEALQDVSEDDEVRVLKATALAHVALERRDWPAFVAAFTGTVLPTADLAELWEYAKGRVAEADGRLAEALDAYQGIADAVRDVVARRDLVRGKMGEEAGDWSAAERWWAALPTDFENAGALRGYAAARAALDREDWLAVVTEAGRLGGFRDAKQLECYGRARAAESTMDWLEQVRLFAECHGFRDSDDRLTYARGRALAADGRWRDALACLLPLADDHRDVLLLRARLADLLTSFGWAEGLGDRNLVPDPSAEAREDFPYRVLAAFGVGPAASMARIKDAEILAMRENATAAIGVATLRSWKTRLGVDADLYPVRDPARLRAALGALVDDEPDVQFQRLCSAVADDRPLLILLHLGREQAMNAWEERLRADPADTAVAHCLAIAHQWSARDLDQAGAWEHGRMAWQHCIGMWVTVLGDETYWERWRRERSDCYQFMVPVAEVRRLRRVVIADLVAELHRIAERHDDDGRPTMAESYRRLGLAVQVETLGRGLLAEVGGITAPVGTRVIGGPVYLRAVGLSTCVGRLVADLMRRPAPELSDEDISAASADVVVSDELTTRLRAAFSRLGPAQTLLEAGRPTRALAVLPDFPYANVAEVLAAPGCDCPIPLDELCESCDRFLAEDPAYIGLAGRDFQLWQDAVRITVECHVGIARDAVLGAEESGVDIAVRSIGTALGRAAVVGLAGRAQGTISDLVSACVDAMTAPGEGRSQRPNRAVEFVETLRGELALDSPELRRAHAEALYHRAQAIAQSDEPDAGDYDRAIADLRLAVELSRTTLMARVGLAHTLVDRCNDQRWSRGRAAAVAEALTVLGEGLRLATGMGPLLAALETAAAMVQKLIFQAMPEDELIALQPTVDRPAEPATAKAVRLAQAAVRTDAAGDSRGALLVAVEAVQADPTAVFARDALIALVNRWAARDPDGSTP